MEEHLALIWRKNHADGNLYDRAANNRGYHSCYWLPTPTDSCHRFLWTTKLRSSGPSTGLAE
jgi:hypothetical protein